MAINLTDLAAAQRAFSATRLQAILSATQPGADPASAARLQNQALLELLQARVKMLTDARSRAMDDFEAEIATYQQKIGEVQQVMRDAAAAAANVQPAAPAVPPGGGPTPGPTAGGTKPGRRKTKAH